MTKNREPTQFPKVSYSIREACAATSLGRTTVYAHIAAGRLQAVRVGGRTLIPAESLRGLLSEAPLWGQCEGRADKLRDALEEKA